MDFSRSTSIFSFWLSFHEFSIRIYHLGPVREAHLSPQRQGTLAHPIPRLDNARTYSYKILLDYGTSEMESIMFGKPSLITDCTGQQSFSFPRYLVAFIDIEPLIPNLVKIILSHIEFSRRKQVQFLMLGSLVACINCNATANAYLLT
jgi:hypothetical protein